MERTGRTRLTDDWSEQDEVRESREARASREDGTANPIGRGPKIKDTHIALRGAPYWDGYNEA